MTTSASHCLDIAVTTDDRDLRRTAYAALGVDSQYGFQPVLVRERDAAELACVIRFLRDEAQQHFVGVDDPRSYTARIWAIFDSRLGELRVTDRGAGQALIDLCSERSEFRDAWSRAMDREFPEVG
ncbi:MAG TPA: hypothetical protein VFQ42_21965 [Mycobacterium sp.]|nr:hypothetical protein [Mycobacterium sp.]